MLKTLIIATVLLPRLAIAQQSQQLPQPGGPDGERHLLRTGLRQGAKSRSLRSAVLDRVLVQPIGRT